MRTRQQLQELCGRLGIPLETCSGDATVIRKALLAGLFVSAATLQPDGSFQTVKGRQSVHIHPSSSLFGTKPACIFYSEVVLTNKQYMRTCSIVDAAWLAEATPVKHNARR